MTDIKTIRAALLTHHAGLEGTSDDGLLRVWRALPVDARKRYLDKVNKPAVAPVERAAARGKQE